MSLTLRTSVLQNLVAKAIKGASNDKILPITGLMALELKDGTLTAITTDASNYLYVREHKLAGEDFYVVVQTEIFSKLISRLTCENVVLEKTDSALKITGNGEYYIDLPLNEEGEFITYPDPLKREIVPIEGCSINLSTIKLINNTAKSSLLTTDDIPCYTGYYIKDKIVATDTFVVCGINTPMWDTPALLSPETLDLLNVFTEEKIEVRRTESVMIFTTDDCVVYGPLMATINDYQIDVIGSLLEEEFDSSCVILKDTAMQLLDRLALFVNTADKNGIYLTFTNEGIQVESKQTSGVEILPFAESENFKPYTCCIDIEMLRTQIKANVGDRIRLSYGKDNAIKLTDGAVTQVIALIEDDRV